MHPILLAAVALVGLPILLHLIMKQEPKRLLFPAIRFLQQKQRTNQRKLRLKHYLLMALRMLIILAFALALFQPKTGERYEFSPFGKPWFSFTLPGGDLGILGEGPVAAVFIIDTSPSMGYSLDNKTRLDDARRRAIELLNELPAGSKVAVVDPLEALPTWEQSIGDARRKIDGLATPHGFGVPVSAAVQSAYRLLAAVDKEQEGNESLPRLVAIFSDRTVEAWKPDRNDDLKKAAEAVPPPNVVHLFFDVGVDQPVNVSITSAEVRPANARPGEAITLNVTLLAYGKDIPSAVVRFQGEGLPGDRREVSLTAGTPRSVTFPLPNNLKPGNYQLAASLETDDRLPADDVRYASFRVGAGRKILTISDDPDDAAYWQLAHQKNRTFSVDVLKPDQVSGFSGYEAVCLLSVSDPSQIGQIGSSLWAKLKIYLERGGKVLVMPGGADQTQLAGYDPATTALGLLPGKLRNVAKRDPATTWLLDDESIKASPFLLPFKEWKLRGNVDFLRNPRRAWQIWEVADVASETVAVRYDDNADPAKRSPAVLEKAFPSGGRLLMLTTRMDSPWDEARKWHDYWETAESSWNVVFPDLLIKYLVGSTAEVGSNYLTGQVVNISLPSGGLGPNPKLLLEGPGVVGRDSTPIVLEQQTELRIPLSVTQTAGNYTLRTTDRTWQSSFSLNTIPEESNLDKLAIEKIEAVTGPGSIISLAKNVQLREVMQSKTRPPLKLFPYLLILVLILFVVESILSNRFYHSRQTGAV